MNFDPDGGLPEDGNDTDDMVWPCACRLKRLEWGLVFMPCSTDHEEALFDTAILRTDAARARQGLGPMQFIRSTKGQAVLRYPEFC